MFLYYRANNEIGNDSIIAISQSFVVNKKLKKLKISNNKFDEEGLEEFSKSIFKNYTLSILDLRIICKIIDKNKLAYDTKRTICLLSMKSTISKLNISNFYINLGESGITPNETIQLSLALKDNFTLTVLHLGYVIINSDSNNIGEIGAASIASVLKTNSTLLEIYLGLLNL